VRFETALRDPAIRTIERWTHARSYAGMSPVAAFHRARLRGVQTQLRRMNLPERGLIADFGCSDGFVLAELRRGGQVPETWRLGGFDVRLRHVKAARRRRLPNARFRTLDLNGSDQVPAEPADVVLCLETLEHVGDYRRALDVLHAALRPGGRLILSMPNEVGLIGFVKLIGRPLHRPRPYRGFFTGPQELARYAFAVLSHRDLEPFRQPPRPRWGPHLGFDHRAVTRYISTTFVETGRWTIERIDNVTMGAHRFLVARRDEPARADA
jgi:2-polyprenyl-3-methyl-5-hydroxy-6-metoxy-1,4-benzoquinol methylase